MRKKARTPAERAEAAAVERPAAVPVASARRAIGMRPARPSEVEQRTGARGTASAPAESTLEAANDNLITFAGVRAGAGVALLAGDRFIVADALGDIEAPSTRGLYASDTRFLSTYMLLVNRQRLLPLSARTIQRDTARFYATNAAGTDLHQGALSLVREQRIDASLYDDLQLTNHTPEPLALEVTLTCAADFLDLFEVRSLDARRTPMRCTHAWDHDRLLFTCTQDGVRSHTAVAFSVAPEHQDSTARFVLRLAPQQTWSLHVTVTPGAEIREPRRPAEHGREPRMNEPMWHVPRLDSPHATLRLAYEQSIRDLHSLEMVSEAGHRLLAAGLPWFVALFGRDMLLTAYETLLLGPQLSVAVLEALAAFQARETDDFRDAEPGKIPHEVRTGRLARLGHVPHTRYYGTVDATLLWLILLSETYRWTGDADVVRRLWPAAEAALAWIDTYGDRDGDRFVEYVRRSEAGLDNQGWKDSWDAIRFADGRLAHGPIALVEVQGYVYDAKLRMAELLDVLGDRPRATSLRTQAAELKKAFNAAFWLPQAGYFALALDRDKRPVDSITSNPGHALWSGIVDASHAPAVAQRLLSDELFSGWGIRTMSNRMKGYSPVSYHNGSVWPHDTALIAAGLARYGFGEAACRVSMALVEATIGFESNRLPELFAGFARKAGDAPAPYPTANAPQAWAAGAVVLGLRTLLGIQPEAEHLTTAPLPGAPRCRLADVIYRGRRVRLRSVQMPDR